MKMALKTVTALVVAVAFASVVSAADTAAPPTPAPEKDKAALDGKKVKEECKEAPHRLVKGGSMRLVRGGTERLIKTDNKKCVEGERKKD